MGTFYGIKHVGGKFPIEVIEEFNFFAETIQQAGNKVNDYDNRDAFFKKIKDIEPKKGDEIVKWLKKIDNTYADVSNSWAFWYRIDPKSREFIIKDDDYKVYMNTQRSLHYFMRHQAMQMFFHLISYFLRKTNSRENIQFKIILDQYFDTSYTVISAKGVEEKEYGVEPYFEARSDNDHVQVYLKDGKRCCLQIHKDMKTAKELAPLFDKIAYLKSFNPKIGTYIWSILDEVTTDIKYLKVSFFDDLDIKHFKSYGNEWKVVPWQEFNPEGKSIDEIEIYYMPDQLLKEISDYLDVGIIAAEKAKIDFSEKWR